MLQHGSCHADSATAGDVQAAPASSTTRLLPSPPQQQLSPGESSRNATSIRLSSATMSYTPTADALGATTPAETTTQVTLSSAISSVACVCGGAGEENGNTNIIVKDDSPVASAAGGDGCASLSSSAIHETAPDLISANSVRDALIEACVEAVDAMCGSGNKEPVEQLRLLLSASATSYEVKYSHVLAQKVVASLLSSGQPEQEDEPAPHLVVLEKVLSAVAKCSAGIAQLAEQHERSAATSLRPLAARSTNSAHPVTRERTRAASMFVEDNDDDDTTDSLGRSPLLPLTSTQRNFTDSSSQHHHPRDEEEEDDDTILAAIGVEKLVPVKNEERRVTFTSLLEGNKGASGMLLFDAAEVAEKEMTTDALSGSRIGRQRAKSIVAALATRRAASLVAMAHLSNNSNNDHSGRLPTVPDVSSGGGGGSDARGVSGLLALVAGSSGLESPRVGPPLSFNIHHPFISSNDGNDLLGKYRVFGSKGLPQGNESVASVLSEGDRRATAGEALTTASFAHMNENADGIGFDVLSTGKNTYIIVGEIGHGMQAPVVRAVSLTDNRDVAIKCLPRPRSIGKASLSLARTARLKLKRMAMEIAALRKCAGHKGLVELIEVIDDKESATLYLVMEFLGATVSSPAADNSSGIFDKRYSSTCVVSMGRRLSSALMYLHRHSIAHMDLKPQNICFRVMNIDSAANSMNDDACVVDAEKQQQQQKPKQCVMPVLLDFGVANVLDVAFDKSRRPTLRRESHSGRGLQNSCFLQSGMSSGALGASTADAPKSHNNNEQQLLQQQQLPRTSPLVSSNRGSPARRSMAPGSPTQPQQQRGNPLSQLGVAESKFDRIYAVADGTVAFSPPERFLRDSNIVDDFCADVYSLGMVLYVLMHGALPWSCVDSRQYINSIIDLDVPFPPQWPRESELPKLIDDSSLVLAASGPLEPQQQQQQHNQISRRNSAERNDGLEAKANGALKEIILRMLEKDPKKRIGIDEAYAALKTLDKSFQCVKAMSMAKEEA